MTIKLNCKTCNEYYELSDKLAWKKGRCHTCGEVFIIEKLQVPLEKQSISTEKKQTVSNDTLKEEIKQELKQELKEELKEEIEEEIRDEIEEEIKEEIKEELEEEIKEEIKEEIEDEIRDELKNQSSTWVTKAESNQLKEEKQPVQEQKTNDLIWKEDLSEAKTKKKKSFFKIWFTKKEK